MKINLFGKELAPFFEAGCKDKGVNIHHQFFDSILFTLPPHLFTIQLPVSKSYSAVSKRGAKIGMYAFLPKLFCYNYPYYLLKSKPEKAFRVEIFFQAGPICR